MTESEGPGTQDPETQDEGEPSERGTQNGPETKPLNSSFSRINPRLQIAMDSTSIGALKKCPRYYQYTIIEGYRSPFESAHLKFGTLFHSATELYDHERAAGLDHEPALLEVVRYVLLETWDYTHNHPWVSDEPTKTRHTLLRSVICYLDYFQNDTLKTLILSDGRPAVELSFRFTINDLTEDADFKAITGEEYILCGHLDRAVEWNDEIWITDKKSTKFQLDEKYFSQFTPDTQISLYSIAGRTIFDTEIAGVIIDGCQVLVNGTRFNRRPIERPLGVLEEWLTDLQILLRENETYATMNYWPQNDKSCNWCSFRDICGADPSVRQELLDSLFIKKTWDPLVPR